MAPDNPRLDAAVRAVADGEAVDWDDLESSVGEDDRAAASQLRLVAKIADVHRALPGAAASSPPAGTAITSGDRDPSGRLAWGPLILLERIAAGAYGDVYRARDPRLDREVALKLLRSAPAGPAAPVQGTVGEARLLARIRHPHVVTVYGADQFDGRLGLWMEFVHGRTLGGELRERGPLSAQEATVVGLDVCGGLAAIHQAGLVHRDIKAENVMREDGGRIVLMDLGAGLEQADQAVAWGKGLTGTPVYTAPEVLAGQPATPSSDIYALGVLLYHLVTGSYPVVAPTIDALREEHRLGRRRPLRDARPDLPGGFVAIVERALSSNPADRFPSAGVMETALTAALVPRPAGSDSLPHQHSPTPGPAAARRVVPAWLVPRTWSGRLALVAVATILVAGGWLAYRNWPRPDAIAGFQPRDWVLVSAFENRTGDSRLDGTVEAAVERELGNSPFVSIVPRERVGDALQLMRRPLNTRVDEAIAREVCLRDEGIRAMVTGRVETLGSVFAISARVVEPTTGRTVLAAAVEAPGAEHILVAVRDLSDKIRAALGESRREIVAGDQTLKNVTTPSLKAWQLYTQAIELIGSGRPASDWQAAGALLTQAVKEDPGFASAHIYLSWTLQPTISNRGREDMLAASARALQLADHATEAERLFILGSYYRQRHEEDKASAAFEALVKIRPDHVWAINNLAMGYNAIGERAKALSYVLKRADLRPNNLVDNRSAAWSLIINGQAAEAGRYVIRARALGARGVMASSPANARALAWVESFPVWQRWISSDPTGAEAILQPLDARPDDDAWRFVRVMAADWLTAFGRLRESDALIARYFKDVLPPEADGMPGTSPEARLAWNALLRGDRPAARSLMMRLRQKIGTEPQPAWVVLLLARVGLTDTARHAIATSWRLPKVLETPEVLDVLRGEVALADGRPAEAVALIERGLAGRQKWDSFRWPAIQSLSVALEALGDRRAALEVLERAEPLPDRTPLWDVTLAVWPDLQARRARLLRSLGRASDADAIEADLRRTFALADADCLVVRQLAAQQPR